MQQNPLEKRKEDINWEGYSTENLSHEEGEAERVIGTVLGVKSTDPEYKDILRSIGRKVLDTPLVPLSDEMWQKLDNTDSWKNVDAGDLKKAKDLSAYYKKNFSGIYQAIQEGRKIPAPIIFKKGDYLHLMSGNNRLMIARGLSQRPMVIVVEYP